MSNAIKSRRPTPVGVKGLLGRIDELEKELAAMTAERDVLRGLVKESIEYADDVITWASRWTPEYVSKASFFIDRAEAATRTVTHE